ncbi:11334_t:CDS:2 [Funneliformis caledonium]|uniref:11334_t:CDS:1 n=1 Tax=Funneliformis caledonium TaxID=1117310 RepID=A0A9N9CVI0_9GLOM|nr:11334_t:CDS:2 [Funneliformis caledonium]
MVDLHTKKSHESKKNIRSRGIIDDIPIDLNQNSLTQDTSIDLPDVINTLSDNDQEIELVHYEENYSFLLKKQSKNNLKRVSNNIFNPVVVIEQDTSDDNNDNKSESSEVNSEEYQDDNNIKEISSSRFDASENVYGNDNAPEFSSYIQDHTHLSACLPLITPKVATSSLAIQDEFNGMDYLEFLSMSKIVEERAETGSESFLGNFLNSKNIDTNLMKKILDLLVKYYRNTYNEDFVALFDIYIAQSNAIPIFLKSVFYKIKAMGLSGF